MRNPIATVKAWWSRGAPLNSSGFWRFHAAETKAADFRGYCTGYDFARTVYVPNTTGTAAIYDIAFVPPPKKKRKAKRKNRKKGTP